MRERDPKELAEALWEAVGAGDWVGAAELLHDDFVQEWPQSGERIVGKENALAVDRNYPGGIPKMTLRRALASGDLALLELVLEYADGSTYDAVSIIETRDGKVAKETDYFAQPFDAPQWRAQWVERI